MAAHKLVPYWVEVREASNPDSFWDQTRLQEHEPDFPHNNLADYFEDFLEQYQDDVHINRNQKKTFTVDTPFKRSGNTIEGRFKSGEWGRNADFWHVEEEERYEDYREENHAEEMPYYFLFHIPDHDASQAILILSKYKRKGIKTTFKNLFDPKFREMSVGDAYMDIEPHYSDEAATKIEEADKIASIKFRGRENVPAREEYADRQNIQRVHDDINGVLELNAETKLTPGENESGFKGLVNGLLPSNENDDFEYGRFNQDNFSKANVTVVEGESQLTFSLWEEEIQMRMDLDPDEHNLDIRGGYPTPHSIGCVARQLANDLMRDLNTDLDPVSGMPRDIGTLENENQPAPYQD